MLPIQDIGDIVIGSVLGDSSQRAIQCRVASLLSGIPETVPVHTVNRCAARRKPSFGSFTGSLRGWMLCAIRTRQRYLCERSKVPLALSLPVAEALGLAGLLS